MGSWPHTTSGRSARTRATRVRRKSSESVSSTVGEAEVLHAGEPDERGRRLELAGPLGRQLLGDDLGVGRPLAAVGAHDEVHGAAGLGPAGQRPAAADVGVVGMGVDGQDDAGRLLHHLRLGSVVLVSSPASRWKSPASSKPL